MAYRDISLFGILLLSLLLVIAVQAHVPLTAGAHEALETATYIHDPLKSWLFMANSAQVAWLTTTDLT